MSFLFVGNWKMNPNSSTDAKNLFNNYKKLAKKFSRKKIILVACPQSVHVGLLSTIKHPKNLFLGAQDAFFEKEGEFTGLTSPYAIYGVGADFVILGHSERRKLGETSATISKKIKTAVKAGLRVIVCVGENVRDNDGEFWHELRAQIEETLLDIEKKEIGKIIIAYEPVWAVGENARGAMEPGELHETALFIKKIFSQMYGGKIAKSLSILYGGSVTPDNARDLANTGDVSGFLVGRASLSHKDTEKILYEVL
ncbi:MAG: triose-phosphate isomerase family protein [Minisyncoccia bacterium]